jgi:hypothetical protein
VADTQAGWYDDGSGTMRWWDGQAWTDSVQPPAPTAPGLDGMISRAQADSQSIAYGTVSKAQSGTWNGYHKAFTTSGVQVGLTNS